MKKIMRLLILGAGIYVLLEMNPVVSFLKQVWADMNTNGGA